MSKHAEKLNIMYIAVFVIVCKSPIDGIFCADNTAFMHKHALVAAALLPCADSSPTSGLEHAAQQTTL